jgi:dipeptidyl aminopeptidase/acylaminoacyl peptidase
MSSQSFANSLKVAVVLPCLLAATPQTTSDDPPGALPYDLAFSMAEFIWDTEFSVSADGKYVAYDVRTAPADTNLDERYQPNGTPSAVVGSKVYFTDFGSKKTTTVCPGGSCWRPVWSSDGKSIAFFSDAGGAPQVWVYDVASAKTRRISDEPVKPKLWHGDEVRWSPDNSTLYVGFAPEGQYRIAVRPKEKRVQNAAKVVVLRSGSELSAAPPAAATSTPDIDHYAREHLVAIKAINVKTGQAKVLLPSTSPVPAGTFRRSATGKWLGFLSKFRPESDTTQEIRLDAGVIPATGGEPFIFDRDVPLTQYDYFNNTYAWHPNDDRLVYIEKRKMYLLDLRSGTPSSPKQLAPELGDVAPTVLAFTRDGKGAVLGVDVFDDKGYGDPRPRAIAIVPLEGGAPQKVTIDDSKYMYGSILKADERTLWQPDGSSVTLLLTDRATGEKVVARYALATGQSTVLWKALGKIRNFTSGGSHEFMIAQYEDMTTPPNLYRFAADFSKKERISHIDPRLDQVAVGTSEVFETTIPLYNGQLMKVRTAVLLPAGAKRGDKLPALVTMYPGGDVTRNAADYGGGDTFTVPNLVFTSRGYAVVLCNLTLGPNREAGNPIQEMIDVLLPQVYHAAELGYVDVNRLAITGQSFGGYGTASIITRTNLFRAAVPISGIYDLYGSYGHIDIEGGGGWVAWNEAGQARMGTHPWANMRRYLENSPYYNADKIFTPTLIVHGTADGAYHDAGKLFTALKRLGRPAQLASYQDQGHVIYEWRRESAIDAAQRMIEFYRRHLGDPKQRTPKTE